MSRRIAALGLIVIIAGILVAPIAAFTTGTSHSGRMHAGGDATDQVSISQGSPELQNMGQTSVFAVEASDFDQTMYEIRVFENGSARWTFQYVQTLDNESEVDTFQTYAKNFRTNETVLYRQFRSQAIDLTRTGSKVTERSMNATNFARDAYITPLDEQRGIVKMSFTWENFGKTQSEGVLVGDVFEGGLYMSSDQGLRFVAGSGLGFEADSVEPQPTNMSHSALSESDWILWRGPQTFSDLHPRVKFEAVDDNQAGPGSESTQEPGTDESTAPGGIPVALIIAALAGVGLVVGAVGWWNGYLDTEDSSPESGGSSSGPTGPNISEGDMVSDEDRVYQLLEENDGRMKQTAIVEGTEWSKSKVSMLLSEMEDEETIRKLQVGRENIITIPGEEPEAARSPFEDDDSFRR